MRGENVYPKSGLFIHFSETVTAAFYFFVLHQPCCFGTCYLFCKIHVNRGCAIRHLGGCKPGQHIMRPVVVVLNCLMQIFFELLKICDLFMIKEMVLNMFVGCFYHRVGL